MQRQIFRPARGMRRHIFSLPDPGTDLQVVEAHEDIAGPGPHLGRTCRAGCCFRRWHSTSQAGAAAAAIGLWQAHCADQCMEQGAVAVPHAMAGHSSRCCPGAPPRPQLGNCRQERSVHVAGTAHMIESHGKWCGDARVSGIRQLSQQQRVLWEAGQAEAGLEGQQPAAGALSHIACLEHV